MGVAGVLLSKAGLGTDRVPFSTAVGGWLVCCCIGSQCKDSFFVTRNLLRWPRRFEDGKYVLASGLAAASQSVSMAG
jgi:hypothetical protein